MSVRKRNPQTRLVLTQSCQEILHVPRVAPECRQVRAWDGRPWRHLGTCTSADEHLRASTQRCVSVSKGSFLLMWECGYLNVCLWVAVSLSGVCISLCGMCVCMLLLVVFLSLGMMYVCVYLCSCQSAGRAPFTASSNNCLKLSEKYPCHGSSTHC